MHTVQRQVRARSGSCARASRPASSETSGSSSQRDGSCGHKRAGRFTWDGERGRVGEFMCVYVSA
eukprot:5282672-Pleurochrysis_carterae.AAC.3